MQDKDIAIHAYTDFEIFDKLNYVLKYLFSDFRQMEGK